MCPIGGIVAYPAAAFRRVLVRGVPVRRGADRRRVGGRIRVAVVSALAAVESSTDWHQTRQQFIRAVRHAPPDLRLSPFKLMQALHLADLMRADGTLECYEDEIAAHLGRATRLDEQPVSGATVRRLIVALRLAGFLVKVARSTPAGPPIFLAASPLHVEKVSGEHSSPELRCLSVSGDAHRVSGEWASHLRKRRKARARVFTRAAQTPTKPSRSAGEPPSPTCCAHCSRRAGAAGARSGASGTVVALAGPPTRARHRKVDQESGADDHEPGPA